MVDYDPFSEAILDDPLPLYAALRRESPVHYLERHDAFALALFEDVWRAGADAEHFESPGPMLQTVGIREAQLLSEADEEAIGGGASLFTMNPPQHTELRGQLACHFTPRAVRRLESRLRSLTRRRIGEALPRGRCDVIGDLAARISVEAACLLIGLPVEDGGYLTGIVRRFFAREPGFDGMPPDAAEASSELRSYLVAAVARRRRGGESGPDAMSALLAARVEGGPIDEEEVAAHLSTLVIGGTETLPKVFAGGVLQLHRHPRQRALLAKDPGLIPDAFTEIARYEMPTNFLTRTVKKDLVLRGRALRAGQGVLLLYRSANRDEREFPDPDRFDVRRRSPRTLAFGHGTHVCLGQHVARLEARILYEELLAALPDYEVLEAEVVPARSEFVAGYLEMPIAFEPRAPRP